MQKVKRKSEQDIGAQSPPKKKKVQFSVVADKPKKPVEKEIDKKKKFQKDQSAKKTFKSKLNNKKVDGGKNVKGNFSKGKKGESALEKSKWSGKKKDDKGRNDKGQFSKGKKGESTTEKVKWSGKKKDDAGKNVKGMFSKGKKGESTTEKPKWSEMKKEKKELRLVRRKAKATAPIFEIAHKAKLLAAQIQRKVVKQEFRMNSCQELHTMLIGQYKAVALSHDLSRVIQVLLKYANEAIRDEITKELLDIIVSMAQSKYAHHSVKRILKYGSDTIRHQVINKFFGSIVSLATHVISAPVLDYAYGEFATPKEKLYMQQEFYGDIYKNSKDDNVKSLMDTYKNSPEMKPAILSSCKANMQKVLDKNLHDGELLHSVLYDYMRECNADDRAELISTLSGLIVPLSNSLPGVNAACMCVWQGTNKDKKTILKVVKEHALSLSKHKVGYRLLLAIFDSVDDTVLVKKAIVSVLANNVKDIVRDHWGKMTLHWLVKPTDTAVFHPSFINFLKVGARSGSSKKDAEVRVAELRDAVLPALNTHIVAETEFWLSEPTMALFTAAILSIESSKETLDAISKAICRPDWVLKKDDKEILAVEDAGMHMCLKKMAALDKGRKDYTLGQGVCEHLTEESIEAWVATNRGCFFILKLIENNNDEVSSKLLNKLKSHVNSLKNQTTQGAKLLLQKINDV